MVCYSYQLFRPKIMSPCNVRGLQILSPHKFVAAGFWQPPFPGAAVSLETEAAKNQKRQARGDGPWKWAQNLGRVII